MEGRIVLVLLLVCSVQIAAWIAIGIDSRRRETSSLGWGYGVSMPGVGLLVVLAYLHERRYATGE